MPQFQFGAGKAVALPLVASGVATPVPFSQLQDFSLDFKFDQKELYGKGQMPIFVGRGKGKVTGSMKNATVNGAMVSTLFFGATMTTGQLIAVDSEASAVPASTPFTVQPANNTAVGNDLGVVNAATGIPLTKVTGTPTAGEYSVSIASGVATYTFAAADAGTALLLNYTYTTTTGGNQAAIASQAMGNSVQCTIVHSTALNVYGVIKRLTIQLNACMLGGIKFDNKNEDFMVPQIDFSAFADASGNVGIVSLSE